MQRLSGFQNGLIAVYARILAAANSDHVARLRTAEITPHVTQNNGLTKTGRRRGSAIDGARPDVPVMRNRNHAAR